MYLAWVFKNARLPGKQIDKVKINKDKTKVCAPSKDKIQAQAGASISSNGL